MNNDMEHMKYLRPVAEADVAEIERKESTYRGSWKRRGGIGAFMMIARKWDRLESMLQAAPQHHSRYDIFCAIADDPDGKDGSALAEVRDLRRYLLLVEAEMLAEGWAGSGQAGKEAPDPSQPPFEGYRSPGYDVRSPAERERDRGADKTAADRPPMTLREQDLAERIHNLLLDLASKESIIADQDRELAALRREIGQP